jgi:putative ABC transport system ATP-binding protein
MFLEVERLKKYYGDEENKKCVLKGVNFSVEKGEVCVMLGPSGSGKSTILNIIGGIEDIDEGNVCVNGQELSSLSTNGISRYRRSNLGFVFQSYNLIPNLTVEENIEVCEYLSENPLPIDELIDLLGLSGHQHKFPKHLSGGQQQRTAIARALVKNPQILLCDEPTGALDYETSKETLKLLETINKTYNMTIIIVTHNEAISRMAHKTLKLRDGMVVKEIINHHLVSAKDINW